MTTGRPPIGVVFDMDGVLVDSADAHFHSWRQLGAECGRDVTRKQFDATFGRQNRDIISIVFGEVDRVQLSAMADRKEAIYRDLIREAPPVVPGAAELIAELHDAGAKLAIGSSGPRANIDLILHALGASDRIMAIVSGDDVRRGKPDPQVFALAADKLGIPPSRCVVIEDAPAGVQAAHAAGAKAIAVLIHHPPEAFAEVEYVVACLADLSTARVFSLIEP